MTSRKNEIAAIAVIGFAVVLLIAGLAQLFALRFERGDAYPAYSSLRADPLGSKALYRSLQDCDGMSVSRSMEPRWELNPAAGTTILSLGNRASLPWLTVNDFELGKLARNGGRIVITYLPRNIERDISVTFTTKCECRECRMEGKKEAAKAAATNDNSSVSNDVRKSEFIENMNVTTADFPIINDASARLAQGIEPGGLPVRFSCHSSLCFTNAGSGWTTLYTRHGRPVLLESRVGKGSIVLSAETYFVSNEALKDERHTALLAWILGGATNVVFDESHHGSGEQKDITDLIRDYGLSSTIAVAALLALMFIWRSTVPLVPSSVREPADGGTAAVHSGRDSASGLENLLKRNLDSKAALLACVNEWEKSFAGDPAKAAIAVGMRRMVRTEDEKPVGSRDYARLYNDIVLALKERRLTAAGESVNTPRGENK